MGFQFTPDQQQVIDARNQNVLVAAAAGSGKTAVLVERIVRLVCDETQPVDIDKLLIATFTSAAASEMRERLSTAIAARLEAMPENEHLQRQSALIHNAQITTIDSFCLFVIRNNFNDIGLDPGFRVADEGEKKLLIQDTLRELAEDKYADKDEDFLYCLEALSASGHEKPLFDNILALYEFSMSFPWPMDWLEERRSDYGFHNLEELDNSSWVHFLREDTGRVLTDCVNRMEAARAICLEPDGPYMYEALLEQETDALRMLCRKQQEGSLLSLSEAVQGFTFGRLPGKRDESVNTDKREAVKEIRNLIKEQLALLKDNYFYAPLQQQFEDLKEAGMLAERLLGLVMEFAGRFADRKREKNIIDFQDMEHFALQILMSRQDGEYRATQAALDYREHFQEILIDEYQDSNLVQEYLLAAISGEEEGRYNRFMVGDVKQSIYRFRLARPEIFMEKYESYPEQGDGLTRRIDLHKNFRSRREVIDSVNLIFGQIMGKQLGNVEYDEKAALYLGAAYEEDGADYGTQLLLAEKGENPVFDKKEAQARMLASKIRELVGHFMVTDKESGQLRPASYRDIVILLRTNAGWDEVFKRVLNEYGIPVYIASKTGYFAAAEVQTVLHFLRIVDNPLQDIPLFGVLKSPIGGFSEEELARIKGSAGVRGQKLYHTLLAYREEPGRTGEEKDLHGKIAQFLMLLTRYRELSVYTPIHRLIQLLLSETDYRNYVSAFPAGEQRQANLRMLLQKAEDFEKTSYFGLFHFIRYMEQIEKYDVDYGEASTLDENADTVRIMSIHKSKGLEFPICFVSGLSKRMNMMDSNKAVVMDVDLGVGVQCVKPEYRLKSTTLAKNVISRKLQLDSLGEELRILYVALTRAKEKLILTGSVEDLGKKCAEKMNLLGGSSRKPCGQQPCSQQPYSMLPYSMLTRAGSYLDFLLPVFIREPVLADGMKAYGVEELDMLEWTGKVGTAYREKLFNARMDIQGDTVDNSLLRERFERVYAHENLSRLYTKTTVSELKKAGMEEEAVPVQGLFEESKVQEYVPRFIRPEEKITGSTRGSAYHKALELLDFECEDIGRFLALKAEEKVLPKEYADCIDPGKLERFLGTSLAGRMRSAQLRQQLYREQPFVLGIPANQLKEEYPQEETVLIQGIIDAYFVEDGQLTVVDYKTDRVDTPEELIGRYHRQLDYYADALERLTTKKVKEKILYSFALGLEILVK